MKRLDWLPIFIIAIVAGCCLYLISNWADAPIAWIIVAYLVGVVQANANRIIRKRGKD